MTVHLRGMAWSHPRGYDPMVATARAYEASNPEIRFSWDKRSLQDFENFPLERLAEDYDLIVIDHPHVGGVAREGYLVALDELDSDGALPTLESQSVAASFESYRFEGHQWALPIDAAAQVSAYRPDLGAEPPARWSDVIEVAREGGVLWPLTPVHALSSFFTLAANNGTPCAVGPERLISPADGRAVLEAMHAVSQHLPRECLTMDPISALDAMSEGETYAYSPLVYGYSNYARSGFGGHRIRFSEMPSLGDGGPRGSTLGGTGIAVSARSSAIPEAAGYAFWVAGAECQKGLYFESGGQPGNMEAWTDAAVNEASHGFFRDTLDTLRQAWLRPRYDGYLEFQEEGGHIVNDFLVERIGPDDTLRRLEEAYRGSLQ